MFLILVTHGDADRKGVRLLSAEGRNAVGYAGVYLADRYNASDFPPITMAGSAPAFRCVETLLAITRQMPGDACTSQDVCVFPQLAEERGGITTKQLSSTFRATDGCVLLSVHGDLPSAFPQPLEDHFNDADIETWEGVKYFKRRPVLMVFRLGNEPNLADAIPVSGCLAF